MLIHGPTIESLVINGVFMLCGSIVSMEPIDYRCVIFIIDHWVMYNLNGRMHGFSLLFDGCI
jgi:hypothetical protein